MKKLVVLSGAGISAESGLKTFREMGGLWEEYDVMEVASPEGWNKNMELVLKFYNDRRRQLKTAEPNAAHYGLAELEKEYDVQIITQNVDNLHERAGSTKILHLHGMLTQARSVFDDKTIYDIEYEDINMGQKAPDGGQLRPHVVWFGEMVPAIEPAAALISEADIVVIVGTSLNVYPAAGLLNYSKPDVRVFLIDPNSVLLPPNRKIEVIVKKAGEGIKILRDKLLT